MDYDFLQIEKSGKTFGRLKKPLRQIILVTNPSIIYWICFPTPLGQVSMSGTP